MIGSIMIHSGAYSIHKNVQVLEYLMWISALKVQMVLLKAKPVTAIAKVKLNISHSIRAVHRLHTNIKFDFRHSNISLDYHVLMNCM